MNSSDSKSAFVFWIFRHGARTPAVEFDPYRFRTPKGMLTSLGAKQMFDFGKSQIRDKYIKKRESDDNKLLSAEFSSEEITILTSDFPRTIKSMQAKLLGMYRSEEQEVRELFESIPDKYDEEFEPEFEAKLQKIIDSTEIMKYIKEINIHSSSIAGYASCQGMYKIYKERMNDPELFTSYMNEYSKLLTKWKSSAFKNHSKDMNIFQDLYYACDCLVSEEFHGLPPRHEFSEEEQQKIKEIQLITCTQFLPTENNQIIFTSMMAPILELMRAKIGLDYDEKLTYDLGDPKMLIYSSHDHFLAIFLEALKPENEDIKFIGFASNMIFELNYEESCENSTNSGYFVDIFFNNKKLKLPGLSDAHCSFEEFEAYLRSIFVDIQNTEDTSEMQETSTP
jgi:hypothetical protein